ncbi:ATP-binding protein [uncultured Cohaesibacter sp.]|uniref:ATP-binding protein n=1 Tax=uncultured Cohaesibacter sp. TaxID=1002546 RepID=UPI00292DA3EC|nr:ATP-binding protein [uncultured Cohaesibacter sp.]
MINNLELGSLIFRTMVVVTLIATFTLFASFYVTYAVVSHLFPELINNESIMPSSPDLFALVISLFVTLLVAGGMAVKLARTVLVPLNSLAFSADRIAGGDLSSRADAGDRTLDEISQLIDDFNVMAARLEQMAQDRARWNAAIAHELRTPLTVLKGRLHGLADGVFSPDETVLRSLLDQTETLVRLVNDLRVVTLTEAGHIDLKPERFDLADVIRSEVALITPAFSDAGHTIRLTLWEGRITADATRLQQMLLALLDNALRHAAPGEIEISTATDGQNIIMSVKDSGPGLPDDFIKHAFVPFLRADLSRSASREGSGLGLSVVRAIAESHGGSASCHNAPEGGAVFSVTLPLKRNQKAIQ